MTEQYRNNYFKLVAFFVDVACLVIKKYIQEKMLGTDSFKIFLNKEKHKLVHIYETSQCCECRNVSINGEKLITKKQLLMLYKSDDRNLIREHRKYAGNKLIQICICKYSAKENIDVRVVDITLANYIIQKCGKHELGIHNWIEQIKDVRNEIFHLSDTKEMTDHIFSNKWTKLEGSIMGIAQVISSECAIETEKTIMQTKKLTIVSDYMLKYEKICQDYWRNKCAEFERAQNEVIEEKAAALHHTMPQRFSRSMEEGCQQTGRKLETLTTMVDQINILINIFGSGENVEKFDVTEPEKEDNKRVLIPVFMQLDIPISWEKTKVYETIDEFRLNSTPDMNIRIKAISHDDLNIYAEVAEMVLCNIHKLRSEVINIMSTMLSEAEIDTTEHAELCVNLQLPDRTAPRKFDIVECTDCSITIEWYIEVDVQDECLSYELDHRPQGTNEWSTETFLSEDVLKGEDEQRMYQLQNLIPETLYECKLRSICNHVNSHYSESLTKQTLIQENAPFAQDQASVKTNLPVSVTLRQQFYIKESINEYRTITSCIKISNTLVFTDLFNMSLIICNGNGTNIHHMPLSHTPWFITELESNTVAVSCSNITILIIDISTDTVTRTIKTSGYCYGISYNDNKLYVVINRSIIHVMDLTGKVIRTIPLPSDCIHDITVDRDRLVCTDFRSIYCCSLDGKLTWKFKKDKYQDLRRVTTDDEKNIYVTDYNTHTVLVLSDDRNFITKSDGIEGPWGIYFDKKEKILLVCTFVDGEAFLFDVKFSFLAPK